MKCRSKERPRMLELARSQATRLVSLVKAEAEEWAFSHVAQTARPEEVGDKPLTSECTP